MRQEEGCCPCDCAGGERTREVEVFVCSHTGCTFRSRRLAEVLEHRDGRHGTARRKRKAAEEKGPGTGAGKKKRPLGAEGEAAEEEDPSGEEALLAEEEDGAAGGAGGTDVQPEKKGGSPAAGPSFRCPACPFRSRSANGVLTHRRTHLRGQATRCGIEGCHFSSHSPSALQCHERATHFAGPNFSPDLDEHCRALVRPLTEEEEEEEGGRQSGRRVRYRCLACGEVRSHRTLAEVHVSKKHLGHLNPVQCHLCHFRTGHTARLKEHVRLEHCEDKVDRFLACDECNYVASTPRNLKYHKTKHHGIQPPRYRPDNELLCDLCGFVAKTRQTMDNHREKMHGSFSCHMCDFATSRKMELGRHLRCAHKTVCPSCRLPLSKGETVETHECSSRLGAGEGRPEVLEDLLAGSSRTSNAKINRSGDGRSFLCVECGLSGRLLLTLQRHVNLRHGNFRCDHCDFRTVHQPTLMKHLKNSHRFPCPGCAYLADSQEDLDAHECGEGGGGGDRSRKQQLRTKVASCPHCGFIINNANSLRTHIRRVHESAERVPCPSCKKLCQNMKQLQGHIRTVHNNIKDLHCHMCTFRTGYASSFKRHMEGHHGVTNEFHCRERGSNGGCLFSATNIPELMKHQVKNHTRNQVEQSDIKGDCTNNAGLDGKGPGASALS